MTRNPPLNPPLSRGRKGANRYDKKGANQMKAFKKLLREGHKILGLIFCVTIAIIGLTGALYSYADTISDYEKISRIGSRYQGAIVETLSVEELVSRFTRQKGEPAIRYIRSEALNDELNFIEIMTAQDNRLERYKLDQYTGEIMEFESTSDKFFRAVMMLHRFLNFDGVSALGRNIVAVSTIAIMVLAISGLYFYIPMLKRNFSKNIKLDFKAKGYGFWYKLHSVTGVYVSLFVLVMCLTGLWWSYGWYRDTLMFLAGEERISAPRVENPQFAKASPQELQAVFDIARGELENSRSLFLRVPHQGEPYEVSFSKGKYDSSDTIKIDLESGAIVAYDRYSDRPLGKRLIRSIYALHSGQFFGEIGKALWCVSSLAMALFGVSGAIMFYKRTKRKRAARWSKAKIASVEGSATIAGVEAAARAVVEGVTEAAIDSETRARNE
jgi:sulfite reductase (NADPH) flavoprotein alpha-component